MKKGLLLLVLLSVLSPAFPQTAADSACLQDFLQYADRNSLVNMPPGERVAQIGLFFLGTPYVGGTLEAPGPETLQVNLHGMDCNTFVENVLALSVLIEENQTDWNTFKLILATIRYRDGILQGYPSRLHYTSDWLRDNVAKVLFDWILIPGLTQPFIPNVNFMSTHPNAYTALKGDSTLLPEIAARERVINTWTLQYLPKDRLHANAPSLQNGDIIAITTDVPGLDFSHMGIALRKKGKIYLLHASSTGKKVMISEKPLSEYLAGIKKHTGIVAVRPL